MDWNDPCGSEIGSESCPNTLAPDYEYWLGIVDPVLISSVGVVVKLRYPTHGRPGIIVDANLRGAALGSPVPTIAQTYLCEANLAK